jgi:cell division protein FtsW
VKRSHSKHRSARPVSAQGGFDASAMLVSAVALLAGMGSVAVFSATAPLDLEQAIPPHFLRQVAAGGLGVVFAIAASRVPLHWWHRVALPLWGLSVGTLILTLAIGHTAGGATRWLAIPGLGFAFQPAEFSKLATVIAVCALVSSREGRQEVSLQRFGIGLALAGLPALLCLLQPDLGNAVLLVGLSGIVLFVAGAPIRLLVGPALLGAAGVALYSLLNPYAFRRWVGFLEPWKRASSEGFQLVQSFVAFGRGGLTGVGLGDGRQKLFYLPEAHTDFILSVIAEEQGLIGVLLVLGGFTALLIAGLRIALRARQRFALLLGFGVTLLLVVPALLNAAIVMGLLPTKGLTLPFLSYGRSSLLISCVAVGLLLAVARQGAQPMRVRR